MKEVLKLARDWIAERPADRPVSAGKMISIIDRALAQPEQEPVARVIDDGSPEGATEWIPFAKRVEPLKTGGLLYTAPPQRPWVGLTDEEIKAMDAGLISNSSFYAGALWAEAKLKEKNT